MYILSYNIQFSEINIIHRHKNKHLTPKHFFDIHLPISEHFISFIKVFYQVQQNF